MILHVLWRKRNIVVPSIAQLLLSQNLIKHFIDRAYCENFSRKFRIRHIWACVIAVSTGRFDYARIRFRKGFL